MESGQNRAAAGVLAAMRPADEKWGLVLKGKRRKCSPFEMMFKKNIVQAKTIGQKKERGVFKLADFRKDVKNDDNSILDISAYRSGGTVLKDNLGNISFCLYLYICSDPCPAYDKFQVGSAMQGLNPIFVKTIILKSCEKLL